jgi:hypothetical protein
MDKSFVSALATANLMSARIITRHIIVMMKHTEVISFIGSQKGLVLTECGISIIRQVKLRRHMIPAIDSAKLIISLKDMFLLTDCFAYPGSVSLGITFIIYTIYIKCMNNKIKIKPGFWFAFKLFQ